VWKKIPFKSEKELRISNINKKSFLPFLHSFWISVLFKFYSSFSDLKRILFHQRILFVSEKEFRIDDKDKNSLMLSGVWVITGKKSTSLMKE